MRRKNIIVVGILMLACALGGFLVGREKNPAPSRHELAEITYQAYTAQGFSYVDHAAAQAIWRQELGDRLQRELTGSWPDEFPDSAWGAAYATVRDRGVESWKYVAGMSQTQQDEIIRYLCFRIERAAGDDHLSSCQNEFRGLVRFPDDAINRNQDKIARAVHVAASSDIVGSGLTHKALAYAVYLDKLDWGRGLCSKCLDLVARPTMGGHQLEWILGLLDEQADKGTQGMVDSEIWGGKTSSAKAQAGAIEVITHFVKQAESYSYGIGNQAIIDAWISFWRKSSARPATQKD